MPAEILLDLSRLVSRLRYNTATGIDRVEMAYAEQLMELVPDRLAFCAVHPSGIYGRLARKPARDFLMRTRDAWEGQGSPPSTKFLRGAALVRDLWRLRPRATPPGRGTRILIHSSPHHLHREALMGNILRRENARLICFLHDLIPIEYPEYQKSGGAVIHRKRVRTIARLASAVIVNSDATRRSFLPYLADEGRQTAVTIAHLGVGHTDRPEPGSSPPPAGDGVPYFVCIGTIEPRKNHLLLLNIWRVMAEQLGSAVPRLVIIGRRGWENEQVIDMLDRCPGLTDCVQELSRLPDRAMRAMIAGARALLMPSFAEGYGIPVAEALSMGVPVICSDLPALREAGGEVPEFLDPLNGPAWMAAVTEYGNPASTRRSEQLARMSNWRPALWRDHVRVVLGEAERIAS